MWRAHRSRSEPSGDLLIKVGAGRVVQEVFGHWGGVRYMERDGHTKSSCVRLSSATLSMTEPSASSMKNPYSMCRPAGLGEPPIGLEDPDDAGCHTGLGHLNLPAGTTRECWSFLTFEQGQ